MLWIKQPASDAPVTGTVVMMSGHNDGDKDLKRTDDGVILAPQPHNDANDPLNWPMWRRDLALGTIGLYSFMVGGLTPLLAAVMSTLSKEFDEPLHKLTYVVGVSMLGMGVGSLFFAPAAVIFGKRVVYLVSQCVLFAGLLWGANAHSFGSLVGARVLSGIGSGPAESLPSASIAEIYFAHERAYRTGIYTLLLLGGKNLVPLVAGFVGDSLGWHWIFYIVAIIVGGCWVCTFFFVHETWWDRTPVPSKRSCIESHQAEAARIQSGRPHYQTQRNEMLSSGPQDTVDSGNLGVEAANTSGALTITDQQKAQSSRASLSSSLAPSSPTAPAPAPTSAPDSWSQQDRTPFLRNLQIYSGRKSKDPYWKVSLRPFYLYLYPPILFSTMLYSVSVVWLSVIAQTLSAIFTAPPYNFKDTSVGLLYIGTFVGGCLGSAIAGKTSDFIVRKLSARNNGVYEPEFRLIMVIPVVFTTAIGMMGFGWSTFKENAWIVPAIFMGFIGFGTSLGSTVSITYAVDSYKMFAAEALVSLNFAKNVMGFCFGIFVPYFLEASGRRTTYVVYGSIEVAVCLFAIPLYRYGKCMRHYRDEHNIIQKLYK